MVYVKDCCVYVILQESYSLWSYIQVFNPFGIYFCLLCFLFGVYGVRKYSFTHSCPVFPAPLTEETVFSLLYIFVFFVKDKVPVGGWIYLQAFYFVSLVYVSIVPVLYCLDDWSFVMKSEVRLISPAPFFFLKIALSIQGLVFPYRL